jgi:hypothetical protein
VAYNACADFVLFYIAYIRPFISPCEFENTQADSDGSGHVFLDYSRCKRSDLAELQFQLIIVFTGKSKYDTRSCSGDIVTTVLWNLTDSFAKNPVDLT